MLWGGSLGDSKLRAIVGREGEDDATSVLAASSPPT